MLFKLIKINPIVSKNIMIFTEVTSLYKLL